MKIKFGLFITLLITVNCFGAAKDWKDLYKPIADGKTSYRLMSPANFDAQKRYPVIVSLHGGGGKGSDNRKQLKNWNQQLADAKRRADFPCYVLAPQAADLWNEGNLEQIKAIIAKLPAVDLDRIYVLGHSMGGHGTYIFTQLDPIYFAAAAPSAGSGLKSTEQFIDPAKIKNIPIWAFHGDKDGVCPIGPNQKVFTKMQQIGGNMKFTTWAGDKHGVSDKFIPGADNGTTEFSSARCDKEPDFMTWLFKQKRK